MRRIFILCLLAFSCFSVFAQQATQQKVISPEIMRDNSVIFRLKAPDASSVKFYGTMGDSNLEMTKNNEGVFEVKVGPLKPDMYAYLFIVDGVKTLDPNNNIIMRDGSHIESRLMIPGGLTELYDVKDVPHGQVISVWYPSPTLGKTRRMLVYTPPGYNKTNETYPTLYLLHGSGGDEEGWINRGRANYILDNLIAQGKAQPMVIVILNGNAGATSAPGEMPLSVRLEQEQGVGTGAPRAMAGGSIPESIVKDVIPFVEANFRVKTSKEYRALSGLSMGGYQTQMTTNMFPDVFNYIGVMSIGTFSNFGNYNKEAHIDQLKALQKANPKLYWIACGTSDFVYQGVLDLMKLYDEVGLKYTYRESEGGHTWNNWRLYLSEFAPMLFK